MQGIHGINMTTAVACFILTSISVFGLGVNAYFYYIV
jgi:hypothetical protein